ncbi:hypothetical protein ACTHGU_22000 [Chitinophagaceae bacterium MMS25-I14]
MLFTRTYRYQSAIPQEDIKSRLVGKHVKVHNLDFEVLEKDHQLKIIPHAEAVEAIKTLPITHIDFIGKGVKTQVVISSKMRKIDMGGPLLIVLFCLFMLSAAIISLIFGKEEYMSFTYALLGVGILFFVIFWMRMESGYFDYVRKIRDYIKHQIVA